jgi:hypothetical protein
VMAGPRRTSTNTPRRPHQVVVALGPEDAPPYDPTTSRLTWDELRHAIQMHPHPPGDRLVYVAGPLSTYGSPKRIDAIAEIRRIMEPQGKALCLPEDQFVDNEAWRLGWFDVCRQLHHLTVITADDGSIGAGVLREVSDALACYVPVSLYCGGGLFMPWGAVTITGVALPSPQVVATVGVRGEVQRLDIKSDGGGCNG